MSIYDPESINNYNIVVNFVNVSHSALSFPVGGYASLCFAMYLVGSLPCDISSSLIMGLSDQM